MKEFFELPWSIYYILGAKAYIGARGELQLQRDLQNSMQIIECYTITINAKGG